jgi:hypothetical protein
MTPSLVVLLAVISAYPAAPAAHRLAPRQESVAPKVWTNDELPWLQANVPISTFRAEAGVRAVAAVPKGPYVKELDPDWYRAQITAREDVIAAATAKISSLQLARESGAGLSGTIPLEAGMTIDADATVKNLQTQIQLMNIEIGDLEDLARQNSIAPGAIR